MWQMLIGDFMFRVCGCLFIVLFSRFEFLKNK